MSKPYAPHCFWSGDVGCYKVSTKGESQAGCLVARIAVSKLIEEIEISVAPLGKSGLRIDLKSDESGFLNETPPKPLQVTP